MRISLPPEIDVAALDLGHERSRRHRAHALGPPRRFRPSAQRCICEDKVAHGVWILWIDPVRAFERIERLLPFALPSLDRRD